MNQILVFFKVIDNKSKKQLLDCRIIFKDKTKIRQILPKYLKYKYDFDKNLTTIIYYDFIQN